MSRQERVTGAHSKKKKKMETYVGAGQEGMNANTGVGGVKRLQPGMERGMELTYSVMIPLQEIYLINPFINQSIHQHVRTRVNKSVFDLLRLKL